MAKSKKQESSAASSQAKPAARKPASSGGKKATAAKKSASSGEAKKAAAKSASAAKTRPAPQAPPIDTGLAAQAAAAMVANRLATGSQNTGSAGQSQESSAFKSLKQSLNKPAAGSLGGILGTAGGQKKFTPTFGGSRQGGPGAERNQTFGADVKRTGVPRRTSG